MKTNEEMWREEYENYDITTNILRMECYEIREMYYLEAKRSSQVEIDKLREENERLNKDNDELLEDVNNNLLVKIEALKKENERIKEYSLKLNLDLQLAVLSRDAARENREDSRLIREEIEEREEENNLLKKQNEIMKSALELIAPMESDEEFPATRISKASKAARIALEKIGGME